MIPSRIAELLKSYIVGLSLPPGIYDQLDAYLALLLRWNAKTNLTAIREPEQIVTRHFGESLFAAGVLFGCKESVISLSSRTDPKRSRGGVEGPAFPDNQQLATDNFVAPSGAGAPLIPAVGISGTRHTHRETTLADLGSGAGFPGIPIKLAFPGLRVTLIESQNKKATFLREVIRALQLDGIDVYSGRAEQWDKTADVVTLRAVEKFEAVLPIAAGLVAPAGRLCLLIEESQSGKVHDILTVFDWQVGVAIANSTSTAVIVGISQT
jgi:16S rRNA (guanine527-N7)-methyltransferase